MSKRTKSELLNPDRRFATVEEWAEHRYRLGQVVPEGHPAFEPWMRDFD
jgi:hypothetical protein